MERSPVHSPEKEKVLILLLNIKRQKFLPVVAFKNVLDHAVRLPEEVGGVGVLEVVVEAAGAGGHALLAKT